MKQMPTESNVSVRIKDTTQGGYNEKRLIIQYSLKISFRKLNKDIDIRVYPKLSTEILLTSFKKWLNQIENGCNYGKQPIGILMEPNLFICKNHISFRNHPTGVQNERFDITEGDKNIIIDGLNIILASLEIYHEFRTMWSSFGRIIKK